MTYLLWFTIFVWLPLFVFWIFNFELLRRFKKTLIFCVFWALVFSVPWDIWAVRTKIWVFPPENNLGILIGGLPLEEYLFIIFVTLWVSTITLILREKFRCWWEENA